MIEKQRVTMAYDTTTEDTVDGAYAFVYRGLLKDGKEIWISLPENVVVRAVNNAVPWAHDQRPRPFHAGFTMDILVQEKCTCVPCKRHPIRMSK